MKLNVKQEDHKLSVQGTVEDAAAKKSDYLADVEVPIVHNVNVAATEDASVDVYDFIESNFVNISAERGQVTTRKIKTDNLTVRTRSGDVVCQGQLQVCK